MAKDEEKVVAAETEEKVEKPAKTIVKKAADDTEATPAEKKITDKAADEKPAAEPKIAKAEDVKEAAPADAVPAKEAAPVEEAPAKEAAPEAAKPAAAATAAPRTERTERPSGGDNRSYGDRGDRPSYRQGGPRQRRKKVCQFCVDRQEAIDFKDTGRLRKFISERAKIIPRRVTGTCARHQRELTTAIKKARQIALLPYVSD